MKEISTNEELRSVQLGILDFVDAFCKEHEIKYFLCGGTLIGAVRHHGYIPWDDDIDLMMLREDYERFIMEFHNDKSPIFKLYCRRIQPGFAFPFLKVSDERTRIAENINNPFSMGINIDIFPIDKLPTENKSREKLYRRTGRLMMLYNLKQVAIHKERSFMKNAVLVLSHILLSPIKTTYIVKKIEQNAMSYRNIKNNIFCGIAVWGYGLREVNNASNYDSIQLALFEGRLLPIPVGYHDYLSHVYGDYMKLPPVEKQISHHAFSAWWV